MMNDKDWIWKNLPYSKKREAEDINPPVPKHIELSIVDCIVQTEGRTRRKLNWGTRRDSELTDSMWAEFYSEVQRIFLYIPRWTLKVFLDIFKSYVTIESTKVLDIIKFKETYPY